MTFFTKCRTAGCEVRWSLIFVSFIHISVLGHSLSNVRTGKGNNPLVNKPRNQEPFTKRVCSRPTKRLHQLTQAEDFDEDYGFLGRVQRILLADEQYNKHDEDYAHGYDAMEDAKSDLEKQQSGYGPPLGVEAKVVDETSFNVSWYAQSPQKIPIQYFMLEYDQAKRVNQTVIQCRQWVDPATNVINQTHSYHNCLLTALTTDHLYQFRVVSYYNDYLTAASPKTDWIYMPGDGGALRNTHPPGFTPPPFPSHW